MRSLAIKLTLAFLIVGLMGALLMAFFVMQRTQQEFDRFVMNQDRFSLNNMLTDYYQTHGNWSGIEDVFRRRRFTGAREGWRHAPVTFVDATGEIVFSNGPHNDGQQVPPAEYKHGMPITVDGEIVGRLLLDPPGRPVPESPEADFLTRITRSISYSALGATVLALILGGLLARTLTRPIRELTDATRAVAKGDLGRQVEVHTQDELGELASSFNQMSADLARASEMRRQMTADIAHELRTPLSVLLGYTEALSDNKLQGTPETFDVMHDVARQLNRLIDDLRTLALADAGELSLTRRSVDPRALLERAASAYKAQAREQGISLEVMADPDLPECEVDPDRMVQVLGNLLTNALRHTPAGGRVSVQCSVDSEQLPVNSDQYTVDSEQWHKNRKLFTDNGLLITVRDTGAGIPPEDLPHIFDRFYRGDKARNQEEGESGLGLAIAKSLVEMHGGSITVDSTLGEGTTFRIRLPIPS